MITTKNPWSYQDETKFMVLDEYGRATGDYVPFTFTARSKWWAKYRPIKVRDYAWARVTSHGKGLSGCASAYVQTYRLTD